MKRVHSTRDAAGLLWILLLLLAASFPVRGQDENECKVLCAPELKFEPAVDFEPLTEAARVVSFEDGQPVDTTRGDFETPFELTFAMDIPTRWPRVELGLDVAWTPFVNAETNPFTGKHGSITENPVELTAEISVTILREEDTGGWVGADVVVADEFGPAERPADDRWYTHKLAFSLEAAVLPFRRLEDMEYLRNVELEGSIDYVATGIPQAGDRFSDELYLDDESPWGSSIALILPIAPLSP